MAFEEDVLDVSFKVATDLSAKQYYFVKLSADNTIVICNGATDSPIGVLQNKPKGDVTEAVGRVRIMGVSRVITGGVVGYGDLVGTDASGLGVAKTADKAKFMGIAVYGAGSGGTASVLLHGGRKTISAV
jgi:hypothetical protein